MNTTVMIKTFAPPPFDEREIWRYAACKEHSDEVAALLRACLDEAESKLNYAVCYRILPLKIDGDICDFGVFSVCSTDLCARLAGCDRAVVFAATVGVGIDRLIARYGRLSPTKALLFQAIGTERAEALCDAFCADLAGEYGGRLRARFSPGYGDLPLSIQRDVFAMLNCEKHIGLTLNESLLMSPSKSVTAFIGI